MSDRGCAIMGAITCIVCGKDHNGRAHFPKRRDIWRDVTVSVIPDAETPS